MKNEYRTSMKNWEYVSFVGLVLHEIDKLPSHSIVSPSTREFLLLPSPSLGPDVAKFSAFIHSDRCLELSNLFFPKRMRS